MKGMILDISVQQNHAVISGDDSQRYTFTFGEWKEGNSFPGKGMRVDFNVSEGRAVSVYREVGTSSRSGLSSPDGYTSIEQVPWYRRSGVNSAFIVINILTFGWIPLILWTCINLLTGDIYMKTTDEDGQLKQWGVANKVIAVFILALNAILFLAAIAEA